MSIPIPARRQSVSASSPPSSIPIPPNTKNFDRNVAASPPSHSYLASSPSATFTLQNAISPSNSFAHTRTATQPIARALHAFLPSTFPEDTAKESEKHGQVRILLLENISQDAAQSLRNQGYHVDHFTKAYSEAELVEKIGSYQAIGIRSKTKITEKVLKAATQLVTIGCFCIGTNQVDLDAAARAGVAVFNSPFANSRSVAELVISEIIALSRQLGDRSREMREGIWNKVSKGCWEIRGKTLGIIGYGHIGSQLSVLAEAFGMQVIYYDVVPIMPLGSARQTDTLEQMLELSDFVSLHVPELEETMNMIGEAEIAHMKQGSYLINNSRGKVVQLAALADALERGHLAGTAVDVFPAEPGANGPGFDSSLGDFIPRLRRCPNTILTPHIGGSTEEAQRAIGAEVASALTRYLNFGTSIGSVNFPEVDLRAISSADDRHIRVCLSHSNLPGVLKGLNQILGNFNIAKQFTDSKGDLAYLLADVSDVSLDQIRDIYSEISDMPSTIKTRLLY